MVGIRGRTRRLTILRAMIKGVYGRRAIGLGISRAESTAQGASFLPGESRARDLSHGGAEVGRGCRGCWKFVARGWFVSRGAVPQIRQKAPEEQRRLREEKSSLFKRGGQRRGA